MPITVRLFAAYREAAGAAEVELPTEAGATVREVWERMVSEHPKMAELPPAAARNAAWASMDDEVRDGDEIVFMPPVSGG